jgi:three-Cys-motif partner protein
MPGPNDLTARDALPAYTASSVTLAKLELLRKYLYGFCNASQKGGPWYGLDLFAGSGLNMTPDGREVFGSTMTMLSAEGAPSVQNAAERVVAIEVDPKRATALSERVKPFGARAAVLVGDHEALLENALRLIPREALSFAVIDPEGFDTAWSTVARLSTHRVHRNGWKMEQLVLFPSWSVPRLQEEKHHARVDRVFGSEDWKTILEQRFPKIQAVDVTLFGDVTVREIRDSPTITAEEAALAWADLYAARFRDVLGYQHAQAIPMGDQAGRLKYHLIFASDNDAGANIMRWLEAKGPRDMSAVDPEASLQPLFQI